MKQLYTFALRVEAAPFLQEAAQRRQVRVLVTGMGEANAETCVRRFLSRHRPEVVFTCGFAGGLDPEIDFGEVLFEADAAAGAVWSERLGQAGARPGRFHASRRMLITPAEKQQAWEATKADAVEMESAVIRRVCRLERVPCATVRVISDPAGETLPVNFNRYLTKGYRLNYLRLAVAAMVSPVCRRGLRDLQRRSGEAARRLAAVLRRLFVNDCS